MYSLSQKAHSVLSIYFFHSIRYFKKLWFPFSLLYYLSRNTPRFIDILYCICSLFSKKVIENFTRLVLVNLLFGINSNAAEAAFREFFSSEFFILPLIIIALSTSIAPIILVFPAIFLQNSNIIWLIWPYVNKYIFLHNFSKLFPILHLTIHNRHPVLTGVATIAGAIIPAGFTLPYYCL